MFTFEIRVKAGLGLVEWEDLDLEFIGRKGRRIE